MIIWQTLINSGGIKRSWKELDSQTGYQNYFGNLKIHFKVFRRCFTLREIRWPSMYNAVWKKYVKFAHKVFVLWVCVVIGLDTNNLFWQRLGIQNLVYTFKKKKKYTKIWLSRFKVFNILFFCSNVQVITAQIQITMLILIISRRIYSLVRNSTAHPEKNG